MTWTIQVAVLYAFRRVSRRVKRVRIAGVRSQRQGQKGRRVYSFTQPIKSYGQSLVTYDPQFHLKVPWDEELNYRIEGNHPRRSARIETLCGR